MKLLAAVQLFKGCSDRSRLRILNALSQAGRLTGTELADLLRLPRSTVARHLRYLYRSRLVVTVRRRGETRYGLRAEAEPLHRDVIRIIARRARRLEGVSKDNAGLARCRKS